MSRPGTPAQRYLDDVKERVNRALDQWSSNPPSVDLTESESSLDQSSGSINSKTTIEELLQICDPNETVITLKDGRKFFVCETTKGMGMAVLKRMRQQRTIYTNEQVETLNQLFSQSQYLDMQERTKVARRLGLTPRQVKIWFQNKRSNLKRQWLRATRGDFKSPIRPTIEPDSFETSWDAGEPIPPRSQANIPLWPHEGIPSNGTPVVGAGNPCPVDTSAPGELYSAFFHSDRMETDMPLPEAASRPESWGGSSCDMVPDAIRSDSWSGINSSMIDWSLCAQDGLMPLPPDETYLTPTTITGNLPCEFTCTPIGEEFGI